MEDGLGRIVAGLDTNHTSDTLEGHAGSVSIPGRTDWGESVTVVS